MTPVSAATRVAAVVGDPIQHSLSPTLHNAGYHELGLDYVYVAFEVPRGAGPAALVAVRALGMVGVNVTMPLKAAAAEAADRRSSDVEALGVANTVVNEAGTLVAHNTDVEGFVRAAEEGLGRPLAGARVVVIGAGGAARAAVAGLVREGAERVLVAARRRRPAEETATLAGGRGRAIPLAAPGTGTAVSRADVVINATPVGMRDESLPAHVWQALGPHLAAMDLVYAPPETPFLAAARAAGARAVGGLGMLVHQAGLAFTLFTGQPAPLEAMSAAAVAALTIGRTDTAASDTSYGPPP